MVVPGRGHHQTELNFGDLDAAIGLCTELRILWEVVVMIELPTVVRPNADGVSRITTGVGRCLKLKSTAMRSSISDELALVSFRSWSSVEIRASRSIIFLGRDLVLEILGRNQ